ncbi:MAG: plasminogen-binding N-terminal domain-containing protein [Thiovulaceae bacterium]|nr:plasminogen-binding N-terminal domain-containing protein [Sulfurimonadaceae bacterium]
MKKTIFLLSLFSTLLLANDYEVVTVTDDVLHIKADDVKIGTSGVVVHKVNGTFETIVSRVEVTKLKNGLAILKMVPFTDLEQEALPRLDTKPAVGDMVKLNWLHQRVLVVASTLNAYSTLTIPRDGVTFIHPDIFAAHLSYEGHPSPLKEDFQSFCQQFDVGMVQIAVENQLFSVDCHSFVVLETKEIKVSDAKKQKPFYTRIKEIDADWWGEGSDPIVDYNKYYLKLLGQKNAG